MSLGSVEAIKALVGAGFGCAILPRMAVRYGKDQGPLVVRSLSPKLHRKLAIVIRRDKPLYRGLKELIRALEDVCKSTQIPKETRTATAFRRGADHAQDHECREN
jgi:DNA-binding transcriptional LysR family regulator